MHTTEKNFHKDNLQTFFSFTWIFLVTFTLTLGLLLIAGKSFVFMSDPYHQHIPSVYYFCTYLHTCLDRILDGSFNFPSWDLSIGYGGDILTTLNYYAIGDPLNLLYIFIKPEYAEYMYIFLASFRMYLAGISFILFSRTFNHSKWALILGAIVYSFSGFALTSATFHPFFLNPLVYLPLALLGIEKIFTKNKPLLFIITVAISLISSFYFSYMILLLAFIYAFVRYFFVFETRSIVHFLQLIGKFILYVINGILLASFILIPVIFEFLKNGRSDFGSSQNLLHYTLPFYLEILQNTFSPVAGGTASIYWTNISLAVISFFAAVICVIKIKNRQLTIFLTLSIVGLCSPMFGKLMNGFSYPSSRWVFAFTLLFAYMVTVALPYLINLNIKEITQLSLITLLYTGVIFALRPMFSTSTMLTVINFFFLIIVLLVLFIQKALCSHTKEKILVMAAVMSIILMMAFKTYPKASTYFDLGHSISMIEDSPQILNKDINDSKNWRFANIDGGESPASINASLVTGANGLSNYFSLTRSSIVDFTNEVQNSGQRFQITLNGLDDRVYLQTLMSTKYLATNKKNTVVPFGYSLIRKESKTNSEGNESVYQLYENKNSLPLGYSYSSSIKKSDFSKLSPIQKQETMLNSVVLDETLLSPSSSMSTSTHSKTIDFKISESDGVEIKNNKINVLKENGTIKISFQGLKNSETYLYLKGITDFEPIDYYISEKRDFERLKERFDRFYTTPTTTTSITAIGKRSNYKEIYSKDNRFNVSKDNALINVGYSQDSQNEITVKFKATGTMKYEDLQVICQPMDKLAEQAASLRSESFKIKSNHNDMISGSVNFTDEKFLAFSIPYSEGWSLTVDGQPYELKEANIMFMGALIPEGKHNIVLEYTTPGKKVGIIFSLFGLMMLSIYPLSQKYQHKNSLKIIRK